MKSVLLACLFSFSFLLPPTVQAASNQSTSLVSTLYPRVREAQDNGRYVDLLGDKAFSAATLESLLSQITNELESLKALSPEERVGEFNHFLRYYSASNNEWQEGAPAFHLRAGVTNQQIRAGEYESSAVARRLLDAVREYDERVVLPMINQIHLELKRDFAGKNILFLGRDFTAPYVRIARLGDIPNLYLANISRKVRDAANSGQMESLRRVLAQAGLKQASLIQNGLVILDSSMAGKIPRAVFTALTQSMNPTEIAQFLSRSAIRYVKSSKNSGLDLASVVASQGGSAIPASAVSGLMARVGLIPVFDIPSPPGTEMFAERKHKLLEWRPKFLSGAQGMEVVDGLVRLTSEVPSSPGTRISALMGLYGDLNLHRMSAPTASVYEHLDQLSLAGLDGLRAWQDAVPNETLELFNRMAVVDTGNSSFPWELRLEGLTIARLSRLVGEGNNVRVYLSERGTVIKVVKSAKDARKQILQAWAEKWARQYQISVARTLRVEPHGLYLEQEYLASASLEADFGFADSIPAEIQAAVLADWEKAKKLGMERNIWLDFKSANYHRNTEGRIVNVDYTPRLNSTYYRYYRTNAGVALTNEQLIDLFFHYDIRGGWSRTSPPPPAQTPPAEPTPPQAEVLSASGARELLSIFRHSEGVERRAASQRLIAAFENPSNRNALLAEIGGSRRLARFIKKNLSSLSLEFLSEYRTRLASIPKLEREHIRALEACEEVFEPAAAEE